MSPTDPTAVRPHIRTGLVRQPAIPGAVALVVAAGVAGALTTTTGTAYAAPAAAATTATVTVDAGTSLGTVPAGGVGLNTAVYDPNMTDPAAASLMKAAGIQQLRYPGGSYGDGYHWKTHTLDGPNAWTLPNTGFDQFMATAKAVGAQPILIANYGSGTAQEAAGWVRYANVDKHYGVKYWEIGNEVYGNGHYNNGSGWETDNHADKSPTTYATNLVAYAKAMKAVDPTVKIGAVLTTPGGYPDGTKGPGDSADWNHTVLSIAGSSIDFVIVHSYPGGATAADLLNTPEKIGAITDTLRSLIATYAGARASSVQIAVTETDGDNSPAKTSQAAALYAPDTFMTWFEHGVFNVDWWDLHNGPGPAQSLDGQTDYEDEGILSSGTCSNGTCEPALETPFPTYWGIRSLTALAAPGDTMVKAASGSATVAVHAVRTTGGGLNVMLINKDAANPATVSLAYSGFTPAPGAVTTVSYTKGGTALTTATVGTAAAQTLPPYSITTLQLKPNGAQAAPPTPAASSAPGAGPVGATTAASSGAPGGHSTHPSAPGSHASSSAGGSQYRGVAGGAAKTATSSGSTTAAADGLQEHGDAGGMLAFTGAGSGITYTMIGSVIVIAAGGVLVTRRRRTKAAHRG
ncbi:hypothetical protein ABH920_004632 [Catenulispora sp. EB89]|uniref:cellulose-binding protein n=1 Tax=Catenulispora sp. EB89 TaxID=3156257 RepID=UPI0035144119